MVIDGKKRAKEQVLRMRSFVENKGISPKMTVITASPTIPTKQFLKIKERVAKEIGIRMDVVEIQEGEELKIASILSGVLTDADGVVMQLPFPAPINTEALLVLLPRTQDPDAIGQEAGDVIVSGSIEILPPVTSAIRGLCKDYHIPLRGVKAVVVGQGRLVGAPTSLWLEREGAEVVRLTRESKNFREEIRNASVIVLGAGAPGLLKPDMIAEGVVIFDAGTSEEGGKVVGDADPACAEKASLFTPVPGGIGPLAVAELFSNMLRLRFDYKE